VNFRALLAAITVAGCAGPGDTIDVISSTPAAVALEYTHSYSFELGETVKAAERQCNTYGKHAVMVSNTRLNVDRALATFRCVN
jgi:hypothetical protein